MNLIELQDHARSLVFAMEMGAPAATVLEGVQRMVNDLGGKLDVRRLNPPSVAIYVVALSYAHNGTRG